MNYDFYKTFVVLAETTNFSKTAEKLNIVQSTVSNRIQELEKYVGATLCSRTNKSVALTQAGLHFLTYAKRIVAIEEESLNVLNNLNYRNTLKVGTVHSVYSGYIKKAAMEFMKLYPDISLNIVVNHTPQLLEMLSDNLIDIAFVFSLPKSNKFVCSNILKDEIILVSKNSKEFKSKLLIEDLRDLPLLYADSGDTLISYIENKINYKLEFRFSIDQVSEIIEYLCNGLGYCFILKSLVTNLIDDKVLKEVKLKDVEPHIIKRYCVINKNSIKRQTIDSFTKLV